MAAMQPTVRSIYRRFLRELPSPSATHTINLASKSPSLKLSSTSKATILSHPSPLQTRIRTQIAAAPSTNEPAESRLEAAGQMLQYLRAQRVYTTLIERYNPGMNMDEELRVKLTARKVGMDLPVEYKVEPFGDGKS